MESGAELDERRDAPFDLHGSRRRLRDAGNQLQRRALAGSVASDDAVGAPGRHGERHALERGERLVGLQIVDEASGEQRALQRRKLLASRVSAIDLRDVGEFDRVHNGLPGISTQRRQRRQGLRGSDPKKPLRLRVFALRHGQPHTSSANESRRRSNRK